MTQTKSTPKTYAQMLLLTGAKTADGEWLYPGLRIPCRHHSGIVTQKGMVRTCSKCGLSWSHPQDFPVPLGFIPNPDPWALIAACQSRGLVPIFYKLGYVELERGAVGGAVGVGDGPDNQAALIDAFFQATAADPPPNWERCGDCYEGLQMSHIEPDGHGGADKVYEPCLHCSGTGFILRSEGGQDG